MPFNYVGKITCESNQHLPLLGNASAQRGCDQVFVTASDSDTLQGKRRSSECDAATFEILDVELFIEP